MPKVGIEPTPPCGDRILNPARLPVPPLRRSRNPDLRYRFSNPRIAIQIVTFELKAGKTDRMDAKAHEVATIRPGFESCVASGRTTDL